MCSKGKIQTKERLYKKFGDELLYRGLSPRTVKAYNYHIGHFMHAVKKPPDKICSDDVKQYLLDCLKRGLAGNTVIIKRSALKIFAEKCLKIKYLEFVDARIKVKRRIKKVASVEEIKQLISCARNLKEQTILTTLFATGIRSLELTKLKISDIDSKRMIIHIQQGKGQKDRFVPLSQGLLLVLRHYYRVYRPKEWLFPDDAGAGPIPAHRIPQIWNYVKRYSNLNIVGGVHLLRHCFATHLLDDSVNINTIQQVLGHASIRSTSRYLAFSNKASAECLKSIDKVLFSHEPNKT